MKALLLAGFVLGQGAGGAFDFRPAGGPAIHLETVPGARGAALLVFVRVGYAADPPRRTGLAHLVEHLVMTAATPSRPEGWTYERWLEERRAGANAMTRPFWTVFASLGARRELAADLRWAAEVLAGKARFTPEAFARERRRLVAEARNMSEQVPGGVLQWRARRLLLAGAAGRPGIGVPREVAAMTLAEAAAFYRRHYRRGRALVVLVGDVDSERDRAYLQKLFPPQAGAPATRATPRPAVPAASRPVAGGRRASRAAVHAETHERAGAPFVSFAFRAPAPGDPDFAAFVLAAQFLARRATLSLRPRGREAAAMFPPFLYPLLEAPEIAYLNRRGSAGASLGDVEDELDRWLTRTLEAPLNDAALELLRRGLTAWLPPEPLPERRARLLATNPRLLYGLALARGAVRLNGFPRDLWQRIEKLRPDEVQRALRRYFAPEQAARLALLPPR